MPVEKQLERTESPDTNIYRHCEIIGSMSDPLTCPSCAGPMESRAYPRALGGEESLDLCWSCQGIWFDAYESTQLTPAGVVALFQQIHENHEASRPLGEALKCPRCLDKLTYRSDITKSGRMAYYLCPKQHGRFTPFTQFLIEKGFIRSLTRAEIGTLSAKIQTIRCSGCGAPVDLQRDTVCGFCHSPIAILDSQAVEKALAAYGAADKPRTLPTHDMVSEVIAQHQLEHENERHKNLREDTAEPPDVADLVAFSINSIFRLLR
jgi:Transcription factor zinc-finger